MTSDPKYDNPIFRAEIKEYTSLHGGAAPLL